ncbi:MAG: DUF4118 domain-containing protein [Lachnospiraceae bacterium]|nr:DUF4118 domain-containing protein [Lachnospiraceae bacterium]
MSIKTMFKKLPQTSFSEDFAKTILCFLLTTFISTALLGKENSTTIISILYILLVVIVSRITEGYLFGIFSSVLSIIFINYFFTYPLLKFNFTMSGYPFYFSAMLVIAIIISALTIQVKKQMQESIERERRSDAFSELNKKLLVTRKLKDILSLSVEYLFFIFKSTIIISVKYPKYDTCVYNLEKKQDECLLSDPIENEASNYSITFQKTTGAGTPYCPNAKLSYLPLVAFGEVFGSIGILSNNDEFLLSSDFKLFETMVSQIALAISLQKSSEEKEEVKIEAASEKMKSTLLRSISHDLRTPLTCIIGSSSTILENMDNMDREWLLKLILDIKNESQWLLRMVENLLAVTHISEDMTKVVKEEYVAEEIVADSISRVKSRFPDRKISVKVPDEIVLVPMDATLIEQVIINLVENSLLHGGEDTEVSLVFSRDEKNAIFEIFDNGLGFSNPDAGVFIDYEELKTTSHSDSNKGHGIGLPICMTIVKAHRGEMEFKNNEHGGAYIKFTLPLEVDENE